MDIRNIEIFDLDVVAHDGVIIFRWTGNIGFGEYVLTELEDGTWIADSECMDKNCDKWFLPKLLEKFVRDIKVEE